MVKELSALLDSIVGSTICASCISSLMRLMPLPFISAKLVSWKTGARILLRRVLPGWLNIPSSFKE